MKAVLLLAVLPAILAVAPGIDWVIPSGPSDLGTRYVVVGDNVTFSWSGVHGINQLADSTAFAACTLGTNTLAAASSTVTTYTFQATTAGTYYFACNYADHCSQGQKIVITVSAAPTCDSFCDVVTAACTGSLTQYASRSQCTDMCATGLAPFPGTSISDKDMLSCFNYHAGVALGSATLANTHCVHAGPTGGNQCTNTASSPCTLFCRTEQVICPANYASQSACETACNAQPSLSTWSPGTASGDSKDCRYYHLSAAVALPAQRELHCNHSGASGYGVCVAQDSAASTAQISFSIFAAVAVLIAKLL